jgi:hypothetical protein
MSYLLAFNVDKSCYLSLFVYMLMSISCSVLPYLYQSHLMVLTYAFVLFVLFDFFVYK